MRKTVSRIRKVCECTGLAKSTVHEHVAIGLLTPPIKISTNWAAWPDDEIDMIVNARIAGWDNDQIRHLVKRLVAERKRLAPEVAAEEQRAAP